jgi:hypothetical protein
VDPWEQQRSSSGSSDLLDEDEEQQDAPPLEQDNPMSEDVVDLWKAEQATRSSISASNTWVLYEAGIICARFEDGHKKPNHYGEKAITLRE